ncbi:MAG: hypothetical protein HQL76_09550, partial [Magnetococcales bacterium]|nr:hypothetical protein [Magnetococcales bacterium]
MTQAVTFDDVWKMFQEMVRENRERSAELDRKIQETNAQMKETDRRMLETDRQIQETNVQMKETDRQMKETARQMRETDRQMQETDRKIKAVSTQLGQLGGRLGQFIEEMIKPSCLAMFQERGIMVDEIYPRAEKRLAGKEMEIDLLLANTVAAVLIEIKSHLTVEDVQEHLTRLSRFKSFFPKY